MMSVTNVSSLVNGGSASLQYFLDLRLGLNSWGIKLSFDGSQFYARHEDDVFSIWADSLPGIHSEVLSEYADVLPSSFCGGVA